MTWLLPRAAMLPLSVSLAHASDGVRAAIELYARGTDQDPRVLVSLEFALHYLGKASDVLLAVVTEGGVGAAR